MEPISAFCCSALINPYSPMVEAPHTQYPASLRALKMLSGLLAGGTIAQTLSGFTAYFLMEDSQAAGMIAHLLAQHLSYYFLGGAFLILSMSNILIKRGLTPLKMVRLPALILMFSTAVASFLLIPRMDYLRETALLNGMPVMQSPSANYFLILNSLTFALFLTQIFSSTLMTWRFTAITSSQVDLKLLD